MNSLGSYYLGSRLRPRRTFDALLADPRRLRFGLLAVAINAVLYPLVYVFLTMRGGAPSTFTPWLRTDSPMTHASAHRMRRGS